MIEVISLMLGILAIPSYILARAWRAREAWLAKLQEPPAIIEAEVPKEGISAHKLKK